MGCLFVHGKVGNHQHYHDGYHHAGNANLEVIVVGVISCRRIKARIYGLVLLEIDDISKDTCHDRTHEAKHGHRSRNAQ